MSIAHKINTSSFFHTFKNNDLKISYDEFGKPYLINSSIKISISHAYEFVAILIDQNQETGIDIELIKPKIERISERFMSANELLSINKQSLEQLYVYWCAKEALYKLYGIKNLSFKENILIEDFEYTEKGKIIGKIINNSLNKYYMLCYEKINEYMLVYVLKKYPNRD